MSTSQVTAAVTPKDGGGFVAIASTGDVDRDGEVILPGCFNPLPVSIPIHLDHTMSAASLVGRGRPYYEGGRLMLEAGLASTADAQVVRQKLADGVIDSMSIVFRGLEWDTVAGVRTCVKGELLAADLVSIPSNRGARVLSIRSYKAPDYRAQVDSVIAETVLALAELDLARAKRYLEQTPEPEPVPEPHTWGPLVRMHMTR